MIIHKDLEQGTDDWFKVRKGKMTASHATAIGNIGKGMETYITELMSEYFSSGEKSSYKNEDMERGNELEAQARSLYELEYGCKVDEVGFIEYNEFVGCSPDGLIGEDGGIEIKCVNDKIYFIYLLDSTKNIEDNYYWQIQMCLLISGRKWWDIVIYNPNFKKPMLVKRVLPDADYFKRLEIGFEVGTEKIKQIINKMKNI